MSTDQPLGRPSLRGEDPHSAIRVGVNWNVARVARRCIRHSRSVSGCTVFAVRKWMRSAATSATHEHVRDSRTTSCSGNRGTATLSPRTSIIDAPGAHRLTLHATVIDTVCPRLAARRSAASNAASLVASATTVAINRAGSGCVSGSTPCSQRTTGRLEPRCHSERRSVGVSCAASGKSLPVDRSQTCRSLPSGCI